MDDAGVVRALWGAVKGIFLIAWYGPQYIYHGTKWLLGKKRSVFPGKPERFTLPLATRFEHSLIVGGSGWGKTQLLQYFVMTDLPEVAAGRRSVIVIDSQGDMLSKILRLNELSPLKEGIADRIVYIDPTDIKYPPCLNLFDIGLERLKGYDESNQEKLLNSALEVFDYIFGALLGAELTHRQKVIFTYITKLLMVIPGATIYTLLDFMEEPELARPYIAKLDVSTQRFFNTQFFNPAFDSTRQQISARLWNVLGNDSLRRMFSHKKNKVDFFAAMNRGSFILINTAKEHLKQEACAIFGRFMIALIAQATQERAVIDERRRMPTFVYIDEAQDYFEEADGLTQLISQGRKYLVGITLATQNLGNFDHKLLKTTLASTKTKFAGGVSDEDGRVLAREMGVEVEFIKNLKKTKTQTEFAIQNYTLSPPFGTLHVSLGDMENSPRMADAQYKDLIEYNRKRHCAPVDMSVMQGSIAMEKSGITFELEEPPRM